MKETKLLKTLNSWHLGYLLNLVPVLLVAVLEVYVFKSNEILSITLSAAIVSAVYLIVLLIYKKYKEIKNRNLLADLSIIKVYKNLQTASQDLLVDLEKSVNVKMFIHFGRFEIGGKYSTFYENMISRETNNQIIRILYQNPDSVFASEARAKQLNKCKDDWKNYAESLENYLEKIKAKRMENITFKKHNEPFAFKFYIFDDLLYLTGYFNDSQNSKSAIVVKMKKQTNSLFILFEKYFDSLWQKETQ